MSATATPDVEEGKCVDVCKCTVCERISPTLHTIYARANGVPLARINHLCGICYDYYTNGREDAVEWQKWAERNLFE